MFEMDLRLLMDAYHMACVSHLCWVHSAPKAWVHTCMVQDVGVKVEESDKGGYA